ncbi:hypothetical protein BCU70_08730 [Vibrio sp. 10N.286.49.C2]|uniref:hypothetical protein n=1 Tax=unclassified Vibrio TaxID=2614977 RepID=UPI000C850D68|nr:MULTISPECIES: hypothetical protein [unclassified Vibrio]PMH27527.1 hypothetical protein BCU70_08730 [Vibrio sp. 10N.286.49.C2]PMH52952.1 hypothetical protein BCU66_14850 [Vibrio sp. 10N.286.49.B1]
MTKTHIETRGAKKGQNRFSKSQQAKVSYRTKRIKDIVCPKVRAICENTHFKNVTAFRRVCAEIYNSNLPIAEKEISYRTLGKSPYWDELGAIFYSFYSDTKKQEVSSMVRSLEKLEEIDKLKIEIEQKNQEIMVLSDALLQNENINPLALENKTTLMPKSNQESIDNLIATINWLVQRSEDIITIDHVNRDIVDLSDDFHGTLDKRISKTFFDYLENKLLLT